MLDKLNCAGKQAEIMSYGFCFKLRFILFFIIILLVDLIGLKIMEVSEYKS